ncbi:MAG TPA: class II aldolase/adducin family protein [Terriglobales bacterium]|nr:class II aldolase/adducin family protein [Terriglobales bacterium]
MNLATQPKLSLRPQGEEIASLVNLSARVGCDPQLVQGGNGNISLKLDGVLWIKASGKWLTNAKQEETFVPVELAVVKESLRRNVEIAQFYRVGEQLRPSIETAMHAVLQYRVVLHVHSVNTIAWAVRRDGPSQLSKRLAGLDWRWVPYVSSGIPLAKEIEKLLAAAPETNVFILGNHGLVICGNDCDGAEALLDDVERRLAVIPRPSPEPEAALSAVLSGCTHWRFPDIPALHALGTDPVSRMILNGGVLYPCQAIFLGPKIPMLPFAVPLSRFARYSNGKAEAPTYAIIEGGGVVVNEKINSAEYATLIGLMQIVQRVEESAPLRYLTVKEVASILGDGTNRYRHPPS